MASQLEFACVELIMATSKLDCRLTTKQLDQQSNSNECADLQFLLLPLPLGEIM